MTRRLRRRLSGGAAALLLAVSAAGCGGEEIEPTPWPYENCPTSTSAPLAIVLGARANSPEPRLPSGIEELVVGAAEAGSRIVVLPVDGEPTIELDATFESAAQNDVARKDDLVRFVEDRKSVV